MNDVALADGLRALPGLCLDADAPRTNMVYFGLDERLALDALELAAHLKDRGILIDVRPPRRVRAVLHFWVAPEDVTVVLGAMSDAIS